MTVQKRCRTVDNYDGGSLENPYSEPLQQRQRHDVLDSVKRAELDLVDLAEVRQMTIDGRARQIRRQNRLTLREIGESCGVTGAAISRWELGERIPRSEPGRRYAALILALARRGAS
jgi:hypothetical protein